ADKLWNEHWRRLSSGRRLRWPRSQGREVRRSAGPAVLEVRARHQQPDRTHARADRARQAARRRRRGDRMKRRAFITLIGGAAAWPLAARAQQADRMRRVGVLMGTAETTAQQAGLAVFIQLLHQLGWTEDRNVQLEIRWGGGDPARVRRYAEELV